MSTPAAPLRWPVAVAAIDNCRVGTRCWRFKGACQVTAIVKGTFELVPGGTATPLATHPICVTDRLRKGQVIFAAETAPLLPLAEVMAVGNAYALPGTAVSQIALTLRRGEANVLDKRLDVRWHGVTLRPGERHLRMRVSYNHALGGLASEDNPLGMGIGESDDRAPHIVDPIRPDHVIASLAPVPPQLGMRKRLLHGTTPAALGKPVVDIPEVFDWHYFQAAPDDQRVERLVGDEILGISGMHPELPLLDTKLPSAWAEAMLYDQTGVTAPQRIRLALDMIQIQTELRTIDLVWRGSVQVDEARLKDLALLGGITPAGTPVAFPSDLRATQLELLQSNEDSPLLRTRNKS
jgi:hypothetical protein